MAIPFLFRCPFTGRTAQGETESDVLSEGPPTFYVGVSCQACLRLHIVNPHTGRLLSEEVDRLESDATHDSRI